MSKIKSKQRPKNKDAESYEEQSSEVELVEPKSTRDLKSSSQKKRKRELSVSGSVEEEEAPKKVYFHFCPQKLTLQTRKSSPVPSPAVKKNPPATKSITKRSHTYTDEEVGFLLLKISEGLETNDIIDAYCSKFRTSRGKNGVRNKISALRVDIQARITGTTHLIEYRSCFEFVAPMFVSWYVVIECFLNILKW
jgi:hypothetical protein